MKIPFHINQYMILLSTTEQVVIHQVLAIQSDGLNDSENPLTKF